MELGGVGRPLVLGLIGRDFAATEAKLSLPAQRLGSSRVLGILTDSVIPASARARLEEALVLVGAIRSMDFGDVLFLSSVEIDAYESAWNDLEEAGDQIKLEGVSRWGMQKNGRED